MTTKEQIEIAKKIVSGGLVDKMYINCELVRDSKDETLYPAYRQGAEYVYAGIDDTKRLYGYIRSNGSVTVLNTIRTGGCAKGYEVLVPLRVVFYNDSEDRDKSALMAKLMEFTFMPNIILQRVVDDKFQLSREESTLWTQRFDGRIFYIAIDIAVKKLIVEEDCDTELCITSPNPICQS